MGLAIIGNNRSGAKVKVVTELPTTGSANTIYLVPNNTTGDNKYDEYIWIKNTEHPNGYFEKVGQKDINLESYALKDYVDKQDKSITDKLTNSYYDKTQIDTKLNTKVDKVEGKGLSTNDYDNAEKEKVKNIYQTAFCSINTVTQNKDNIITHFNSYGRSPQEFKINAATSEKAGVMTASDKAKLDKITDDITNDIIEQYKLDKLTYGVQWNTGIADPVITRIGNMQFHRDLPIQNGMKGCIAQMKDKPKNPIIYYLNENDWRFKAENPTILTKHPIKNSTITHDVFATLQYENQYVKIKTNDIDIIAQVTAINTTTKTATLTPENVKTITDNSYDIELGSVLNGYDGEVMVEVPEFWIRSWEKGATKEVRISQTQINDTWEHQPHMLISPYHETVLNTVPKNMGYLSTLEINSSLSVVNIHDYCRGGNNNKTYDQYLTTDKFRTMLGKPNTNFTLKNIRINCRKSGKEILNYLQYKRVIYWLYVIEYANFNSQDTFNSLITSNGFKQGGLGSGITNVNNDYWIFYNNKTALTPNGYTNEFGNKTNIKIMTIVVPTVSNGEPTSSITQYVPRWHGIENIFGDIWTKVDGVIINASSIIKNNVKYSEVYATDNPLLYNSSDYSKMKMIGIEYNNKESFIQEFDLGNTAEIIPNQIKNANAVQYKCDYHWININTGLRELMFGGDARYTNLSGLGYFCSSQNINSNDLNIGYRSSYIIN